jgi:lysozyme
VQADERLAADVARFGRGVEALVKAPVSPNQMAAMVSLAYNIGLANFGQSTLLRKINAGDLVGAADQFIRWNRARGKVMTGLTRRRTAEASLFRGSTE